MSTPLFNGSLLPKKTGMVLSALAAIVLSGSSAWAALTPQQGEITAKIQALPGDSTKTILTASPAVLAEAVAQAILSDSTSSTKAELAEAAFGYVPTTSGSAVRTDRSSSAAVVTGSAISTAIVSDTTLAMLQTDVAAITEGVAVVNGTNTKANLSVSGQEAVVKTALEVIANAEVTNPNPNVDLIVSGSTYLTLDKSIGNALADDTTLQGLTKNGLVTILQAAIVGVDGVKVGSINYPTLTPANIPAAAAAFVAGIIQSGTVPAVSGTSFDVAILKNVSKNTTADELVAYQIGTKTPTNNGLDTIATALFKAYPSAVAKITQGLTAVVTPTDNTEASRVSFVESLLPAQGTNLPETKNVTAILQGAVFTDPVFAGQFTSGIFSTLAQYTTLSHNKTVLTGSAALSSDAAAMATALGAVLGQDGDALTRVASVFSDAISTTSNVAYSGALKVSNAPTYATDLIAAAVKGLPATNFMVNPGYTFTAGVDGGVLVTGTGKNGAPVAGATISSSVVKDLESVVDLFANSIVTTTGTATIDTSKGASTVASEIGTLVENIAKFTKGEVFVPVINGSSVPVEQYLAGSLAQYIYSAVDNTTFGTGSHAYDPQTLIINQIEKDLKGLSSTQYPSVVAAIGAAQTSSTAYAIYGAIGVAETAITNF